MTAFQAFVREIEEEARRQGVGLPDFLSEDDWRKAWNDGLSPSEALEVSPYVDDADPIPDGDDDADGEALDGDGPEADAFPS